MKKRPFRFAVQSFSASSAGQWRERARRVEALGYSTLHLADHILGPGDAIDAALLEHGAVGAIARPLFTDYVVPFELTGILLLVAIVGALVLAKKAS